MKLGTNYPHGPLEWADIIGIPNVFEILSALQRFYGEDRYRPHPLLRQMKELGEKFYV
jgi:3-hydroxybutyryl-CoA dehydrogenase